MTPRELADEIMPQIEQAYKDMILVTASKFTSEDVEQGDLVRQQSKLGDIRIIIPIPLSIMEGATITAVAELVKQRGFIAQAGELEDNVLLDEAGDVVLNCHQQDMVGLEIFCKPLRDVRLA